MASSEEWTIYHNPRCSKSRGSLLYLEERNIRPQVIEYLNAPPDEATLRDLLKKLRLSARELLRTDDAAYAELNLADPSKSDDELICAIAAHPILMQRPVVVRGEMAVIGRPPEAIECLL